MGDRDSDVLKAYENLGVNMATEFGADPTAAAKDMAEILDLEIQLANVRKGTSILGLK